MNKIIKNTLALTLITTALGTLLGVVHEITLKPIEVQEQLAKDKAYREVFDSASSFETVSLKEGGLAEKLDQALDAAGYQEETIDEVTKALDADGNEAGYVFTVTTAEGYGGDIQFTLGVTNDGVMQGISFLTIGETAGLGMRADTEDFRKQFQDRKTEQLTYSKTGASSDDEIDALSGATITTNAVTNGVNAGLVAYQIMMEGGTN
ncbi:MAG: FMN-binding protein [Lachnospiraceae bacterium]|nr:FMN-binding protein [Lachnospiraceae bacterium]